MGATTLYYFIGFLFFIACIIGLQKWFVLPQPQKDKVGLTVLSIFLIGLTAFVCIVIFKPNYLSAETTMAAGIVFVFVLIVFTAFFIKWYNDKNSKKVNIATPKKYFLRKAADFFLQMASTTRWLGNAQSKLKFFAAAA